MKRSVLLSAVIAVGAALTMPSAAAAEPHCAPGWNFSQLKNKRVRMLVQERRRMENASNSTAQVTFSSKKSKTVKMSASLSIEASYNAIFTSVKAKIDVGVEKSVTTEVGEQISFPVKPHRAGRGKYGVFIRPVRGRLTRGDSTSSCTFDRWITAYLPRETGWRTWTTPL